GLWSVLGMKVDVRRRALWACASAQPQMSKADPREDGAAAICNYDLRTRKLLQKFLLPRDSAKHLLGDLAVASSGEVYATDSLHPIIYRIRADGKEIETFLVSDEFVNLQGLAFSPDEKQLLVADYSKGLFRIDLASKDCLNLQPLGHSTLMGLDGLYAVGDGSYIAVQNGTTPNRILRILLSPEARKVESLSVLESNNPIWDEPTLGVIAEGGFYYNGASQWGAVSEKGEIAPPEKLRDAIVQRLPL
ncbi:MAG TPA: hypothetical protein VGQ82_11125, partial [Chthoniobacterales bacterium]|nr:hypothetical protein [Chthoniobacterales bacterium]